MFAGLECRERLRSVVGNRRVDVDGIDVGILEQVVVIGVPNLDAELIAAAVEFRLVAAANGVHLGVGVMLVNLNKLGPKAEANDRNSHFFGCHVNEPPFWVPPTINLNIDIWLSP